MEFEQLLELIRTVSASGLTEFKFEEKGTRICMENKKDVKILRTGAGADMNLKVPELYEGLAAPAVAEQIDAAAARRMAGKADVSPETAVSGQNKEAEGELVVSPLVGTFYSSPQEDAETFVKVGDTVKKGQVLAIIEAMKLMNEIESETDGTVTEILAENGQAVEYGQPLFRISRGVQ